MTDQHKALRKRLLTWHRNKSRGLSILDLLESGYQGFRRKVNSRVGEDLDFREAIKQATEEELQRLHRHIEEEKCEARIRRQK